MDLTPALVRSESGATGLRMPAGPGRPCGDRIPAPERGIMRWGGASFLGFLTVLVMSLSRPEMRSST